MNRTIKYTLAGILGLVLASAVFKGLHLPDDISFGARILIDIVVGLGTGLCVLISNRLLRSAMKETVLSRRVFKYAIGTLLAVLLTWGCLRAFDTDSNRPLSYELMLCVGVGLGVGLVMSAISRLVGHRENTAQTVKRA